jgi:2-polyprenyl-3-methyl-5-hydroxy-6-metoxy-1,4-benzoquinol methylase
MSAYTFKNDPYSSHHVIPAVVRRLSPPGRVLDVGCDEGFAARDLVKYGFQIHGIDKNPVALDRVAQFYERTILANVEHELPTPDGLFDAIIFADILEHLTDPAAVYHHFTAQLAPGGLVVVSVPNVAHLYVRLMLLCGRFDYAQRGILDRTHLRFFTLRTARRFLEEAGFRIEAVESTPLPLPLLWAWTAPGRPLSFLHKFGALLARRWKTLFAYQLIFAARRQ